MGESQGILSISHPDGELSFRELAVVESLEAPDVFRFEIEEGVSTQGDPKLLKLVFGNLVENAIKFSPAGGVIRFGEKDLDGRRAFFVQDSGVGFDMAFADKLWSPFTRLVREEEFPGTGIGLANVHQIVLRHRGKVWAESEPGKGSTFYFSI